jgi:hypothetical protein
MPAPASLAVIGTGPKRGLATAANMPPPPRCSVMAPMSSSHTSSRTAVNHTDVQGVGWVAAVPVRWD